MSQLLFRLSKLSSRNSIQMKVRLFSTGPYLTHGTRVKQVLPDGCEIGDVLLFDPAKEELVTIQDKTIPRELNGHETIGASHGWGFYSSTIHRTVRISDLFNPLASKSNPTVIDLPQLTLGLSCTQTTLVRNVAMSSSSPHQEDCVVAIKFLTNRLSLCRPSHDSEWTNIYTSFHCSENSNVMYSNRDQRFYLLAPGGNYLFSYDRHSKKDNKPYVQELVYRVRPELDQSEWELLSSCSRTDYLVESPSTGERFLVKWYSQGHQLESERVSQKTIRFLVFREEETTQEKFMCYTEDIGDMCIFLSGSEAFCIPASSCQGLNPNTIYFVGRGLGFYDLGTGDEYLYGPPGGAPTGFTASHWLPPFSI